MSSALKLNTTDTRSGLPTIASILNVTVSAADPPATSDSSSKTKPFLAGTSQLLRDVEAEGKTIDNENLISQICFEIVSLHVTGHLKDSKYTGNKQGKGNGEKIPSLGLGPLSGSGMEEAETNDISTLLTYWFLDSIERSYEFEREYPKVIHEKQKF